MVALQPLPDFSRASLQALDAFVAGDALPPVESWHPAQVGAIDIRITADGRWLHEGGEITRPRMVRLFSRILRREGNGEHVLVTPAEKLTITVEDAAFIAVELRVEAAGAAQQLLFRLNTGDIVTAGAEHPLVLRDGPAGRLPYLRVRGTAAAPLEARLARPVYYALADLADAEGMVASSGMSFALGDSA